MLQYKQYTIGSHNYSHQTPHPQNTTSLHSRSMTPRMNPCRLAGGGARPGAKIAEISIRCYSVLQYIILWYIILQHVALYYVMIWYNILRHRGNRRARRLSEAGPHVPTCCFVVVYDWLHSCYWLIVCVIVCLLLLSFVRVCWFPYMLSDFVLRGLPGAEEFPAEDGGAWAEQVQQLAMIIIIIIIMCIIITETNNITITSITITYYYVPLLTTITHYYLLLLLTTIIQYDLLTTITYYVLYTYDDYHACARPRRVSPARAARRGAESGLCHCMLNCSVLYDVALCTN